MSFKIGQKVRIYSVESDLFADGMEVTLNQTGEIMQLDNYKGCPMYLVNLDGVCWWYRFSNLKPSKLRLG